MGRPKGARNKFSKTFREGLILAYHRLGGAKALQSWGKANPTEFYRIAARLIPTEIVGPGPNGEHLVKTVVDEHRA